jgi:hypothetical protein
MNLEAFRKKRDAIPDVTTGPDSRNAIESKRRLYVNADNSGVRMNAAQQSRMKHVGQANIAHVDAAPREKAARLVRLNAAADEPSSGFRHCFRDWAFI